MKQKLNELSTLLEGGLYFDNLAKTLYATDASVYRELPLGVAFPKHETDIKHLIDFCILHQISIIPRAAGTSLAGQCVGDGLVVDISKHFTKIFGVDKVARTVTLQPGVIRDDLNRSLAGTGLFFGPNTSTANRCMLGGMVGNNSSGTTSIKYGVTRDKVVEIHGVLSDGSKAVFKALTAEEFQQNLKLQNLEGAIYREFHALLTSEKNKNEIRKHLPKSSIHRRNTGYALDELLETEIFSGNSKKFNFCKLLTGSEGTLAFTTQLTLQLDPLPPKKRGMVAAHFHSVKDCLEAVVPVMKHSLFTCEMMDKVILDCTKDSIKYRDNRFFVEGDPEAILMLEVREDSQEKLNQQLEELSKTLNENTGAYAQPLLHGAEIEQALELRKAGLGLLGNLRSDRKAVACIEDTAVALEDLSAYIAEFSEILKKYDQRAVYYAHAGAGELHLRPLLNLKKSEDVKLFREITRSVAQLVKKYNGSWSGEHGDGRVRAEFIEEVVGTAVYECFKRTKQIFDPDNVFNPGKIVAPKPMDTSLRYEPDRKEPRIPTLLNFSDSEGILKAVENCNGSGDCRKSAEAGGSMCPSYRATKNEKDTTRARANALREFLTQGDRENKFDHPELKEVLDLCISCKGCKSECPSNVDMATYKAEFQYQYQQTHGSSLRSKLFAYNHKANQLGAKFPGITNGFFSNGFTSGILKSTLGIAKQRNLPLISKKSLRKRIAKGELALVPKKIRQSVYLFVDEFTEHLDSEVGADAVNLLMHLGYEVKIIAHEESGRSYISKGFLQQAQVLARKNIELFSPLISEETPLLGIEPSAILSFRDEYLRLAKDPEQAKALAKNVFLIEEFISKEIEAGNIKSTQFTSENKTLKIHGHCHQKALSNTKHTFTMLNLPENYTVTVIPSGCCGMAGSFGYEKEHYEVSMKIGNQTLFPAVKKAAESVVIAANGTSCRHQIKDGTSRCAKHPVSIFWEALRK